LQGSTFTTLLSAAHLAEGVYYIRYQSQSQQMAKKSDSCERARNIRNAALALC
jgi:hypothetical protein